MNQHVDGSAPLPAAAPRHDKAPVPTRDMAAAARAFLAWLAFDMDSELAQFTMPGSPMGAPETLPPAPRCGAS